MNTSLHPQKALPTEAIGPRAPVLAAMPSGRVGRDPAGQGLDIGQARVLLAALEDVFDHVARALAARCAPAGKLDPDRLDADQLACYELAFARSELAAAGAALDTRAARPGPLAAMLCDAGLAEVMPSAVQRLQAIAREIEIDLPALARLLLEPAYQALQAAGRGAVLARTGAFLLDTDEEIGAVQTGAEVDQVRDTFRRFGQDVVAPLAADIHRRDLTVPEALLAPMREMGVFGLSVPLAYGGSAPDQGEDSLSMIAITEALSEASLAAAGSLITRPEIMTRAMLAGGTQAQKAHFLPRIAAGDPLCAIAITEPDYGSDVAALRLRGTRTSGGWLLDGAKTWCTFAGKAGLIMVVTRTDPDLALGHKGLSVMLVEKPPFDAHDFEYAQPGGGTLKGRAIATIGYRGMHSFDLSFDAFFVPDSHVLGGEEGLGRGFYFTMRGMTGGRMQTAARACGVMRAALTAALRYAADRRVFGAALGSYQLTQVKLARMAARLAACRGLTYAVGRMLDAGTGQMEASLAKLFACRSAEIVTREALQIHGGMGYAEECAVSRYFVDARVLSIFEGAEETLALKVVARELLQRALGAS